MVSGWRPHWMIILEYVLFVFLSNQFCSEWTHSNELISLVSLSLSPLLPLSSLPPSYAPHLSQCSVSVSLCQSPHPCSSCSSLLFPILSWNMDRKGSACLPRALCQKLKQVKLLKKKKKKKDKKRMFFGKMGKQMFRVVLLSLAVCCLLQHTPYRITRYGHSSSWHTCVVIFIHVCMYIYLCLVLPSLWPSYPQIQSWQDY